MRRQAEMIQMRQRRVRVEEDSLQSTSEAGVGMSVGKNRKDAYMTMYYDHDLLPDPTPISCSHKRGLGQ